MVESYRRQTRYDPTLKTDEKAVLRKKLAQIYTDYLSGVILAPKRPVTRAMAAVMLMRFLTPAEAE